MPPAKDPPARSPRRRWLHTAHPDRPPRAAHPAAPRALLLRAQPLADRGGGRRRRAPERRGIRRHRRDLQGLRPHIHSTPAPAESVGPEPDAPARPAATRHGRSHINPGTFQTYTYCPPASGFHVNVQGLGPIQARFLGPDDASEPQGWVHNLEHGGLVVLYSCAAGCPDEATSRSFGLRRPATFPLSPVCKIPAGITGPVVARFDDMKTRFAALLWDTCPPGRIDSSRDRSSSRNPATRRKNPTTGHVLPGVSVAVGGAVGQSSGGSASPVRRVCRPERERQPELAPPPTRAPARAGALRPQAPARASVPAPADKEPTMRLLSHRDPATGKRSFGVVAIDLVITADRARERRRPRRDGRPARHVLAARLGRLGGAGQGRLRRMRQGRPPRASRQRVHPGRRDPDAREDHLRRPELPRPRRRGRPARPGRPLLFAKFANAVVADGDPIVHPAGTPRARPRGRARRRHRQARATRRRPPTPWNTSPATSSRTTSRPATGRASRPPSATARSVTDSGSERRGRIPSCR